MWGVSHSSPGMLGADAVPTGGITLNTCDIVSKLTELVPGIHADPGSRLGFWHPEMDEFQGLFYYHKHVCSMDRGITPQWPEWNTEEDLAEVPIDYAMRHADFPVLSLKPDGSASMYESDMAYVMRPMLTTVKRVGWAEVFYKLIKQNIPGVTPEFLGRTFRVPMDWYGQIGKSPIAASYDQAKVRGWAA